MTVALPCTDVLDSPAWLAALRAAAAHWTATLAASLVTHAHDTRAARERLHFAGRGRESKP